MTNKPNTDKTIEQIKHDAADNYAKDLPSDSERFFTALAFSRGFDAAIQLCEQRERDLVEALEWYANEKNWLPMDNTHWFDIMNEKDSELYPDGIKVVCGKRARLALKKHRGEND